MNKAKWSVFSYLLELSTVEKSSKSKPNNMKILRGGFKFNDRV